jgi:hypothetical protein
MVLPCVYAATGTHFYFASTSAVGHSANFRTSPHSSYTLLVFPVSFIIAYVFHDTQDLEHFAVPVVSWVYKAKLIKFLSTTRNGV